MTADWRTFVLQHGRGALAQHLAAVVGQPTHAILALRARTPAGGRGTRRPQAFADLFARWHGRPPRDDEWPAPLKIGGGYEWLPPERALLARLVGRVSVREIQQLLSERLRQLTGDRTATRAAQDVQRAIQRLGLQAGDLVGGLTTREAARVVGRVSLINQAITGGALRTFRVGHRHVIPHAEFERWLSTREKPPDGWVPLSSLRAPLGISSDSKLPEYAALGHIPDVRKVAGIGTKRGLWYIAPTRARQILDDARAGRPLPWHGKPLPGNQLAMWRKWQRRKHRRCRQCRAIWRRAAPATFEAFCQRYPALTLGEKRHLTIDRARVRHGSVGWRRRGSVVDRMRDAGLTVPVAARQLQQPTKWIRSLLRTGLLDPAGVVRDALGGEALRITPVGMAMLRGVADGQAAKRDSGTWCGVHVASQITGVCLTTVHRWRALGQVRTRRGGRGLEFERASLEACARKYWAWALKRYKRPTPPAWLHDQEAA